MDQLCQEALKITKENKHKQTRGLDHLSQVGSLTHAKHEIWIISPTYNHPKKVWINSLKNDHKKNEL